MVECFQTILNTYSTINHEIYVDTCSRVRQQGQQAMKHARAALPERKDCAVG